VVRWIEAAEAVLHARLGIASRTFGLTPRVRLEVDFRERLYFLDDIDIDLAVIHVGRTSLRYRFDVRRGETVAVTGELVAAYLPRDADKSEPWPEDIRRALTDGGDRTGE
jgi:acyl-CoA thioester hydrolase